METLVVRAQMSLFILAVLAGIAGAAMITDIVLICQSQINVDGVIISGSVSVLSLGLFVMVYTVSEKTLWRVYKTWRTMDEF